MYVLYVVGYIYIYIYSGLRQYRPTVNNEWRDGNQGQRMNVKAPLIYLVTEQSLKDVDVCFTPYVVGRLRMPRHKPGITIWG